MIYNQLNFLGGLSTRFNRIKTDLVSYPLLINGRVRENVIEPILRPLEDELAPDGLYQNLTAVGSVLLLFVSGECYYRDTATTNGWRRVSGLLLDAAVDTIDTENIPASTINYKRSGPIDAVKFNNSTSRSSEEGIIATDGINQPALIYPQLGGIITARPTFTYAEWTETPSGELREYVPVGRFPLFVGSNLYMAIKSDGGYLNRIARSVTGRPLDFVVAIDDTTGDKAGDALFTAHSVGFDPLVGLYSTSADDAFLAATGRNVIGVVPDYSNLQFFGEPALRNRPLFDTGVLNNIVGADINGDSAFINQTGIHSFNATRQNKIASNNDPLSSQLQALLAPQQTYGATGAWNDYVFFALETIFGPGVVVLDKTIVDDAGRGRFVALDLYEGIGRIKQYAKVSAPEGERLFFITADNRLFEFGAADTRETCRYYLGDWNSATGRTMQVFRRAFLVFADVLETMTVQFTEYVDGQPQTPLAYMPIPATELDSPVIPVPYRVPSGPTNAVVHYETTNGLVGLAAGALVEWNSGAKLAFITFEVEELRPTPTILSQLWTYAAPRPTAQARYALVGDSDPGSTALAAIMALPADYQIIGLGDYFYGANPATDYAGYADSIQQLIAEGRWHCIGGNHDYDHDAGLIVQNRFQNGKRYGVYTVGPIDFFFYNVGWSTSTIGDNPPPYEPDGFELGSIQANWLRGALGASTARFKIVVLHYPPYSSGQYSPGYSVLRLPFRAWGATAVITGHDHNYQRTIVDGLNYIIAGTGGHNLYAIGAHQAGFQAGRAVYGYLRIHTDEYNLRTAHVGVDGTVYDPFVIRP